MAINETLISAITPIVPICVPNVYTGEGQEYCVFHVDERPDLFGDDSPQAILYTVLLHWYLPLGSNPLATRRKIKRAILEAGGTYPGVVDDTDADGQHFIFEFEYIDGDV